MERNENGLFVAPRQGDMGGMGMPIAPREGCGNKSTPREGCGNNSTPREGCGNNGTSREGCGMGGCSCNMGTRRQLAMVYAPMQCFRMLYNHSDALMRGTLFEELDKPLEEGVR